MTPTLTLSSATAAAIILIILYASSTYASKLEFRSLVEFKKGIKTDPSGKIFSTWNPSQKSSMCPSSFYGVICDQSSVVAVHLDGMGLTGRVKLNTLLGLKSLQNLTLSGNLFNGRLGLNFGGFSSLQYLDLSHNQFSGPIPVTGSISLEFLDLSKNHLSGQLNDLDKLHSLVYLDLSVNNFTGDIPKGLSLSLHVFNVSYNSLQGTIPENLRRFPYYSFYPGNILLVLPDRGSDVPNEIHHIGKDHSSKSSVRIPIIVACVGAVLLIVLVFLAYKRAHLQEFCVQNGLSSQTAGREIRLGMFSRPSISKLNISAEPPQSSPSFSEDNLISSPRFSNDNLLSSNTRSLSETVAPGTGIAERRFASRTGG